MKESPERPGAISRRAFVQTSAATVAALSAPLVVPSRLLGKDAPSNRVRVGHIGAGRIAQGHDMVGVASSDLADVLAVCDLDSRRAASGKTRVERLFAARP
ncbi:MAG TPA: twin-arginine translocation signal domain-containing protein, partial [Gemmatimonadaceae bacterium]|nr:twin-arginine translocation signal domain-containing protein [Gemmatimonadaceae bacterium]